MVVPCFNESSRFDLKYWKYVVINSPEIQWVFINDGSEDGTSELINSLVPMGAISFNLENNVGKAEAIRSGIMLVDSKYSSFAAVGYVDADMAFDKVEIIQFCKESIIGLDKNAKTGCYIASRVKLSGYNINRSSRRHFFARIIATWLGFFWPNIPYDTQCGLKVFRKTRAFDASISSPFVTRWLFDIELMMRLSISTGKDFAILERPLLHWSEMGQSKINLREKIRIARELFYISRLLMRNHSQN